MGILNLNDRADMRKIILMCCTQDAIALVLVSSAYVIGSPATLPRSSFHPWEIYRHYISVRLGPVQEFGWSRTRVTLLGGTVVSCHILAASDQDLWSAFVSFQTVWLL